MPEEKAQLTINQDEDGRISIQGNKEDVKKAYMLIAELILKEDEITEAQLETIVDIAEKLYNYGKGSPDDLKTANEFLETVEKYSYPRAIYELAMQTENNSLIAEARMLRAATVGASPAIGNLQEEYTAQAAYWRKRINEAEGKLFDSEAPTSEEILDSDRLRFFNIYKKAFNGDIESMKICLEFCNEEIKYWDSSRIDYYSFLRELSEDFALKVND